MTKPTFQKMRAISKVQLEMKRRRDEIFKGKKVQLQRIQFLQRIQVQRKCGKGKIDNIFRIRDNIFL